MTGDVSVAYRATRACRICGGEELTVVTDLGLQALTGVFPSKKGANLTRGPLELVKCGGDQVSAGGGGCGLVQLRHTYDPGEMYGENYGYRSSLNRSMADHLRAKVAALTARVPVASGDVVLDIGSNDGTTLSAYPPPDRGGPTLLGIDPTSAKFAKYYPPHVVRAAEFFGADTFFRLSGGKKAKIVTSISMFYDLETPMTFVEDIAAVLADDGIWHLEQSYLPAMLAATSYDTICHEHIEYYALRQIEWMTRRVGLRIVAVDFNAVNGGSFAVTVAKGDAPPPAEVQAVLDDEDRRGFHTLAPYRAFALAIEKQRAELLALLANERARGHRVFGLGASTKGNVLLQYCGLTEKELPCVAEVNEDKFGCFTPGTDIPIVSEAEAALEKPDAYLVLPWHFRDNLIKRQAAFLAQGGRMIFPLPKVDVVASSSV